MASRRGIGILKEVYNIWERRAPLCPTHVASIVQNGTRVVVQPSTSRIFTDAEYLAAGAELSEDLGSCNIILGVKQPKIKEILPDKTYMFFSHVIKGQPENMPLLNKLLEQNCRLIDYERVRNADGTRQIAFGKFAGFAGMIDSLRGLGEKLLFDGYTTPFCSIGSAYMYPTFEYAKEAVQRVGDLISSQALPKEIGPFTFVFTGRGNVSQGAQEIFQLLPHEMVSPEDLSSVATSGDLHRVYGCEVGPQDMVTLKDVDMSTSSSFDMGHYYDNPDMYRPIFHEKVIPHTSVLMNCMYWDQRFPRLLTNQQLRDLWIKGDQKLKFLGDLTCDIGGSVEFLQKDTKIETPFYSWDVLNQAVEQTFATGGVGVLGVDILPSELPREASTHFGDRLLPYLQNLESCDMGGSFEGFSIVPDLKNACITYNGQLTPEYEYIAKMTEGRKRSLLQEANKKSLERSKGSRDVTVTGHLFDSGLLNQMLDLMEANEVFFQILDTKVRPNYRTTDGSASLKNLSSVVIRITTSQNGVSMDEILRKLDNLVNVIPNADAKLQA